MSSPSVHEGLLVFWTLLGICLLAGSASGTEQPIFVERSASGELVLSRLPKVLENRSIAPKLTTGLTTTFYFRATAGRRETVLGGAEISLRYDLWQELFLLTIRDGLGGTITASQPEGQLADWWSSLKIALAPPETLQRTPGIADRPLELKVSLTVLPFSSSELADTKRWLSRTGATGRRQPTTPGNLGRTSSHLFDLLLGTSLERRILFSQQWTVPVIPASGTADSQ